MPRVLVADDSAVVRVALVRRFKGAGLEVVEAASVAEAKEVDPNEVDFAVLDFDLGDAYGNEIATHLRAVKPNIPLCFFTSSSKEAQEKAAPFGPIFAKPEESDKAIAWALSEAQKLA